MLSNVLDNKCDLPLALASNIYALLTEEYSLLSKKCEWNLTHYTYIVLLMNFGIFIEHSHNAYGYELWNAWIGYTHIQSKREF